MALSNLRWSLAALAAMLVGTLPAIAQTPPSAPTPPPGTAGPSRHSAPQGIDMTAPPPRPPPPGNRRISGSGDRQLSPPANLPTPAPPPPGNLPTPPPSAAPSNGAAQPSAAPGGGRTVEPANKKLVSCEEVRRKARFGIYFDKVDIEKLVQTVSDATCKTFILPENVRGKISIIGPENGKVDVDADQFYAAFLAALDANNLTVYPLGRFLKIVDKKTSKQTPLPIFSNPDEPYPLNEQMVTKIFKLKYADLDGVQRVVQSLVTQGGGESQPYAPDTLIVHDVGSNLHRIEELLKQLDARSTGDEIRIIQVKYAAAPEVAATIQKLFEQKNTRPSGGGGNRGSSSPPPMAGGMSGAPPSSPPSSDGVSGGGPVTLTQAIPDERTNKIILVASPAAFERIEALVREVDVPISGEGRINVYYLANANAEELAGTLQGLAQGGASGTGGQTRRRPDAVPLPGQPPLPTPNRATPTGAATAELFSGDVKISADKGTNSLVIVASQADYRNVARVIEKLDIPRRQVFVEAVIMEVNLDRNNTFGMSVHQGLGIKTGSGTLPGVLATKYSSSGLPPSLSLANLASFGGFLAGIQGPVIPGLKSALGIDIPAFGIVLHAMQQSSDVNVLSTPHLLTSDNEEAEIVVGQNVPFQAGFQPSSLGASALGGAASALGGASGAASPLLGLGGLGSFFAPINRQNVELKLTLKPQINESDFIRMVITEQTEEIASQDPVLGPTTSKRSAKTTVVARDQETVVLGGIMQERVIESVSKVPILGDIPILGYLFREQTRRKVKTNLLLFLTPYIIRDQTDFRRIFERKLRERQQFVEQFYGQVAGYDVPVDFTRKAGPTAKLYQAMLREESKAENGGPGLPGEHVFRPGGDALPAGSVPPAATTAPLGPGGRTVPTDPTPPGTPPTLGGSGGTATPGPRQEAPLPYSEEHEPPPPPSPTLEVPTSRPGEAPAPPETPSTP